jgi:MFS family permease
MMGIFQSASVISLFVGPPLGGLLLHMDGLLGLHGWQWLYLTEALPPIVMCVVVYFLLTDRPKDATWLTPEQRIWLQNRLDSENAQRETVHKYSLGEALANPKVLLLTLAYFGSPVVGYGTVFFLPLIVKGLGVGTDWIGLVTALPFLCAFVAMIAWGYSSDLMGERTYHVVVAFLITAVGLAACIFVGTEHPYVTMALLCLAIAAQQSVAGVFWSIPSAMLTGVAAAGGVAMINAIGNLGGWLGPTVYGVVKDATGSTNLGLLTLAVPPVIAAIAMILVGYDPRTERLRARR